MNESFLVFDESKWLKLKKDLKKVVGDTAYNNWLKQLGYLSLEENILSLSVPTKFLRDWIFNNYADKIKVECKKINEKIEAIKIVVKPAGGRIVPGTDRIAKNDEKQWNNSLDIRNGKVWKFIYDFNHIDRKGIFKHILRIHNIDESVISLF